MPMDRGTPDLVRHCVAAVAEKDGDTSRAFAICVAQLQKNGYLKPGTIELTAAGKAKEKEHEMEPDASKKLSAYEKLLKANRKDESTKDSDPYFFDRLARPTTSSGYESVPHTVARRQIGLGESSMDSMRRLAGISRTGTMLREASRDPVGPMIAERAREVAAFLAPLKMNAEAASESFAEFADDKTIDRKVKSACDNASRLLEQMSETAEELEAAMAFLQKAR